MPRPEFTEKNRDSLYLVFVILTILFLIVSIAFKFMEAHTDYGVL